MTSLPSPLNGDNLIGGAWVASDRRVPNLNPSDPTDVIGHFAQAGEADMDTALRAARSAFGSWSHSSPQQRFDLLDAVGSDLLARKAELGALLSREEGKSLAEGIGEVTRAGQIFKFFAGEALRLSGERLDSVRPGVTVEIRREPVGVVGLICPWNFPIAIPAWKLAPALAYGNTVILKPAELTPACAWVLADSLHRHGCPPGVFNLVVGKGSMVGPRLIEGCDAISFTGSEGVGVRVRDAAVARGIRVQTEMGGKNPLVVLDDADLDVAVSCALNGAFFSTGQRCTASSRLIVTEGIAEAFVDKLAEATRALVLGPALDPATQIGPCASADQQAIVREAVDRALQEGAVLRAGGPDVAVPQSGYFYAPTLLDHTTRDMAVNREEIFGPVASIIRVADLETAIIEANATPYGLSSGICTRSLKAAETFKREAQAGMVMVNLPTAGVDYHVPFGGRKGSSFGPREQGSYAREFYTVVKTAYQLAL